MSIKHILTITLVTLIAGTALLFACNEPTRPMMPVFRVVSLAVAPAKVATGQEATVTAQVQNTGNIEGNYQAVLSVNDEKQPAKSVVIGPGDIGTVVFKVSRGNPGLYDLTMGGAWATLDVKKYVERQAELSYGSPIAKDFLFAGANSGHLIDFTLPDASFVLKKISICAGIYGTGWHGKSFELFVLDKNMNSLFSQVMPITTFPQREQRLNQLPVWREIEIDSISMPEKFFIYVYTNVPRLQGLHLGVDNTVINTHSDVVMGTPPDLTIVDMATLYPGIWCADRSKVNWMIKVSGTSLAPE